MKRALWVVLLAVLWAGCGGPPPPAVDPTLAASLRQDLVLSYPLDGNADDASSSGNDGRVRGALATADRFGRMGSALAFDGSDDWVVSRSDVPVDDAYSVSLWVRPNAGSAGAILYRGSMDSCWYDPYLTVAAGSLTASVSGCEGSGRIGTVPISEGQWHHVVLVITGGAQWVYLDGQEVAAAKKLRGGSPVPLAIGATGLDGGYFHGFEGAIDDVAVYARPLSAAEVQALYTERGWSGGD